ncbi:alkaline phosphatase D family protein [Ginsengibacter hankyongi]|nr:alkaline phosphatase D family protein [Ginsengibacter hankyongi]
MSNRRKFIRDLSLSSAAIAIGVNNNNKISPFDFLKNSNGPFMATGIKIGEVSSTAAIIWTRLTKSPVRVTDDAPQPTILYKNPTTGKFEHKEGKETRPNREPKIIYPRGIDVNTIAGAVPGTAGEVRVLWTAGNGNAWKESAWQPVNVDHDATRQFVLSDLLPGKKYEVKVQSRMTGDKKISAIVEGSFKTAPAINDSDDIKFMVVTCQEYHDRDYAAKGFKIYEAMLRQQPDFFVHTGDVVYYDQQAKNIDLARWHWQRVYSFPTLVEFHKNVSSYFMKDDHDTWMNDCWPTMETKFMGDFTFQQGQQVFLEQVPMGDKPYRTFQWGKDLQIWLVEGRDFRSPNNLPDGPGKTIWGKEQIEWFKQTVQASNATFKILISPTPLVGPDRPKKNDNYANEGFYHEGELLRKFVEQQKMYVVNGDRHWQYASKDVETGLLEFGCGPVSNEHAGGWTQGHKKPEHLYVNVVGGYLEVNVIHSQDRPSIVFTHRSVDGKVLFEYKPIV